MRTGSDTAARCLTPLLLCVCLTAKAETRLERVQAQLPAMDQSFTALAEKEHIPGLAWAVVLDGKLIHKRSLGLANVAKATPVAPDTVFRIASMTKSFVALAILRLRDEGKLQLDDPVSRYLPELGALRLPGDAGPITVRHLLSMSSGLPEDNPWGDRQMAMTRAELARLLQDGLSFSTQPGGPYEYSNLGYIMLGHIVSQVSGQRFQDYISSQILRPLGMHATVWEYSVVKPAQLAQGYQWLKGEWVAEPILHDGGGAAMGGLLTTIEDFARYTAFLMDAWPAREGADKGPVRRASVRELGQPHNFQAVADGRASAYGYGLRWQRTRDLTLIGHGGGLPGYGSQYWIAPERGLAVFAFGNLRYAPVYTPVARETMQLIERASLAAQPLAVSPVLAKRAAQVLRLLQTWDEGMAREVVAMNFFLDRTREDWIDTTQRAFAKIGPIVEYTPLVPENALRGSFTIVGRDGKLKVFLTLTPEHDARLQELQLH